MVVEIPIKVVNQTSAGLTQIKQDVAKVSTEADKLEKEFKEAEKAADDIGATIKDNFLKVTTGISAAVDAGRALIDGVRAVGEGIQSLADQGSPAFQRLQGSIDEMKSALVSLADDPAVQEFADWLANGFRDAVPHVRALGDEVFNLVLDYRMAAVELQVALGNIPKEFGDAIQMMRPMIEQHRKDQKVLIEQERELAILEKERLATANVFAQVENAVYQQRFSQHLQEIKSQEKLQKMLKQEEDQLKMLSELGKSSDEDKQQAQQKLMQIHSRIMSLEKEQETERKAAAAAQKKDLDDFLKLSEKLTAEANKRRAEEKQAELDKKAATLQPQLQQLRSGIGDRQVFDQIVKQRTAGMGEKEALATRRELFRNRGQIGGDEIEGARDNLLKDTINQMRQSGQLDTQTAHALQQAQQQMQAEREGAQANQDMLKEVTKQFGETLKATVKGQQETQRLQNLIDDLTRQVEQVGNNANALQQQSPAQRAKVSRNGG
jgi:hypothetical protein